MEQAGPSRFAAGTGAHPRFLGAGFHGGRDCAGGPSSPSRSVDAPSRATAGVWGSRAADRPFPPFGDESGPRCIARPAIGWRLQLSAIEWLVRV